jgi:NAD(P)-dependent dehydrogenase (short-subunit alcohol dehydrogenase family)
VVGQRSALITGASQGLGRAFMRRLAGEGWAVAGVARGADALSAVVAEITAHGGVAYAVPGDVGRPDEAARIAGEVAVRVGTVDLAVHCASTLGPVPLRPLLELGPLEMAAVLETNLLGPFRLTRLLVGPMVLRGRGTVVFVSSDAAVEPYADWGAYGVSKAALDHLARIWAREVPEVRFLAIDPTDMDTAMHAAAIPGADRTSLARPEVVADRMVSMLGAPSGSRLVVRP